MLTKYFFISSFLWSAEAWISSPGFVIVRKQWPELVNQTRKIVHHELSNIFPNVEVSVYSEDISKAVTEEYYYDKIKLVVNENGIVVEPPVFFGGEPDFSFVRRLLGKHWNTVKKEIMEKLPVTKFVIYKNGKFVEVHERFGSNYVLLDIESDDIVRKMPLYVRGLPGQELPFKTSKMFLPKLPLHEVTKMFTDKWPFAKFKVYQHGYNDSEECYGYIKIVCVEDIVVQPPTYKAMEPDMEQLHFVVGQAFSPLIEQIKEKFPTAKIGVEFDGKPKIAIRNTEERQYILIEIANNNRVYFAPRFERFPQ